MKLDFLKLSARYFFLGLILLLILASKVYLIREGAAEDFYALLVFGVAMVAISYLGAWAVWLFSGRNQRTGEIAYLVILTLFFLARTILLYREALAGREAG